MQAQDPYGLMICSAELQTLNLYHVVTDQWEATTVVIMKMWQCSVMVSGSYIFD